MKLTKLICPSCGAILRVDMEKKFAKCEFCGTEFLITEETHKKVSHEPDETPKVPEECKKIYLVKLSMERRVIELPGSSVVELIKNERIGPLTEVAGEETGGKFVLLKDTKIWKIAMGRDLSDAPRPMSKAEKLSTRKQEELVKEQQELGAIGIIITTLIMGFILAICIIRGC